MAIDTGRSYWVESILFVIPKGEGLGVVGQEAFDAFIYDEDGSDSYEIQCDQFLNDLTREDMEIRRGIWRGEIFTNNFNALVGEQEVIRKIELHDRKIIVHFRKGRAKTFPLLGT